MNKYIITWNQIVYRNANKVNFSETIAAVDLVDCLNKIRTQLHLNPFYLLINGAGVDQEYKTENKSGNIAMTF